MDERVVLVSLSKEGINVLNRIQEYSHNKLEKILALLNQDDIEQIIDSIDRFIQCCEKVIYQEEVE